MKPLDKIVLHAIPLKNLFKWLSKTRDPNLVEATVGGAPEKALVLAVTKHMLYEEDPPSVGVGLVYKPHYISTECLHASEHVACCGIQWGLDGQTEFCPLHTGLHLRDERGGASCAATPHLPGCVRQGSRGENWGATGSSLVSGFQAPYCVE